MDDETSVRLLLRMLFGGLGLLLALLALAGFWAQNVSDEELSRTQTDLTQRLTDAIDQSELSDLQKRAFTDAATQAVARVETLQQPVVYGGLVATSLVFFFMSLWALGESTPSPSGAARKADKVVEKLNEGEAKLQGKTAGMAIAPEPESDDVSGKDRKKHRRVAAGIEKDKGPEAAGDYLRDHGLKDDAAELYISHELFDLAAEVRHDQNRFEEAGDLYTQASKWEMAGKIYAQVEAFEKAARCYLEVDKKSVAAEMFERSGQHRQAGDCYRDIGFGRHAAKAYLEAGAEFQAAQALASVFVEEGGIGSAKSETQVNEMRQIAKKAGDIFFRLERFEEAFDILVKGEAWGPAAKVAFHIRDYERAAELFARIGRGDLAAKALGELGRPKEAAKALGGYLRDQGELAEAASKFKEAGEWVEAAGVYRSLDQLEEAGAAYFEGQDWAAAAEMFQASGAFARAGEAYRHNRQYAEAAQAYARADMPTEQASMHEQAGELFEAARIYREHERLDDAIRIFQQIEEDDPQFGDACAALGELFAQRGMDSLSIKKYEQATSGAAVSQANVRAYYGLGRQYEDRGDSARAAEVFEQILTFDYHFEDVSQRLEGVKSAAREEAATKAAMPRKSDSQQESRYDVQREIGRGGMGVVYLARDRMLERDVAYKVLPEQLRENPDALRNFMREAKAAAQLNHPNIVTVYDVGEADQGFYLAMEFVEGTTLKEIVQRRGPIAPGGLVYILRQMADALGYAHTKKVVHRDIKTANTMWTPDKQVKIMDFGLAKLLEEVRNATTTISGTPFYMSPEQTLGKNVDHRTDLYSLGVTLFELATGDLPFRRGNVPYHHVHTAPPDPRSVNAELPAAIAEVILRCLQKAPDDRYASAKDIVDDLGRRMKASGGSQTNAG